MKRQREPARTGQTAITRRKQLTVEDLVHQFLSRPNERTRRAYASDLRDLARFLGDANPVAALDHLIAVGQAQANWLVLGYQSDMAERGLAPATRNRRVAAIRSAMRLGRIIGLVKWTLELRHEKVIPYRKTAGPGEPAYRAMLEQADVRDAAILSLLHDLALRRGEVTELDMKRINLERKQISIMGKGRIEREIYSLPESTAAALRAWIAERGPRQGPLFIARVRPFVGHRLTGRSIYNIVKALARKAGVKRATPHGLRHTAITRALDLTGGDVRAAQKFSRHRNIQSVLIYDDRRRDDAGRVAKLVAGEDDHGN